MTSKFVVDEGKIWGEFENMRIIHPRLEPLHRKLSAARRAAQLSPYGKRRQMELFAPSHAGKSMAITTYIESQVVDDAIARGLFPPDMNRQEIALKQRIVLHVELSPKATPKSVAVDILRKLGDQRAANGSTATLLARAYGLISDLRVELVVLDEIQHLASSTDKQPDGTRRKSYVSNSTDVADTFKDIMIKGLSHLVLVGLPEARALIEDDGNQVANRELGKIDFSPLRWSDPADRNCFLNYCGKVGLQINRHGLMPEESDFVSGDVPHLLWASSGGLLGLVSRIAEQAVIHACERGATRVEREDLEMAVDTRAIPNGMCTYNPFREGVRKVKVVSQ